jgi:hypothetical protein
MVMMAFWVETPSGLAGRYQYIEVDINQDGGNMVL